MQGQLGGGRWTSPEYTMSASQEAFSDPAADPAAWMELLGSAGARLKNAVARNPDYEAAVYRTSHAITTGEPGGLRATATPD